MLNNKAESRFFWITYESDRSGLKCQRDLNGAQRIKPVDQNHLECGYHQACASLKK